MVEIKSAECSAESQQLEQMVGLLHPSQHVMTLGRSHEVHTLATISLYKGQLFLSPLHSASCIERAELFSASGSNCTQKRWLEGITMARKRPIEEIESLEVKSLDTVNKPVSSTNIHGIVTSLSRNYFDVTVSDATSKLHMVGFSMKKQMVHDFSHAASLITLHSFLRL